MMKDVTRSLTTLVTLFAGAQHVNAGVLGSRQVGGCAIGSFYSYDVSSTVKNQLGDPVTSDWNCVGTSGCTATQGSSFTVGKTVTVGANLDLDFDDIVAKAGVSASVSITTLNGETGSVSLECPKGPWTCALIITPPVTIISGTARQLNAYCLAVGTPEPYTMELPEKMGSGGVMMGGHVDICACRNFASWADAGAPSIVCPQDCVA